MRLLMLYLIPATLYCFCNNLVFANLLTFDPTTYYLLLQLRIVVTAILFQYIFKNRLSNTQWVSLLILMGGCMLKQLNIGATDAPFGKNTHGFDLSVGTVLILVQIASSCIAGVYTEYLIKREGSDVDIFVQNIFMYVDSIVLNAAALLVRGDSLNLVPLFADAHILVLVVNNATVGIITSLFLKSMNSILKTIANAIELLLTAILCYLLFGFPIHANTIAAIGVVAYALYLYSSNPVTNITTPQPLTSPADPVKGAVV